MSREPSENWPPKKTFFVKGQYWFINITIVLLPLPLPHTYTYHRMKVFGHISSDVLQAYTSHAHTHFRRKQHIIISCTESRPRPSSAYSKCTNCMRSSGVGGWSREHSYCIFQPWPLLTVFLLEKDIVWKVNTVWRKWSMLSASLEDSFFSTLVHCLGSCILQYIYLPITVLDLISVQL